MKDVIKQIIIVTIGCLLAPVVRKKYRLTKDEVARRYALHKRNVIMGEPDPWLDDAAMNRIWNSDPVLLARMNLLRTLENFPTQK